MPCAWPGCANGVELDEFEWAPVPGLPAEVPGLKDLGPDVQTRVRLDSFDGRERYFWKARRLPWILLETQIRNHEMNTELAPLYLSKIVYHYTTLNSLVAIIDTQDFWLSDYAYLNDSTEVRHGQSITGQILGEIASTLTADERAILTPLDKLPPQRQPRICVGCFSFERDSLSQWRGYTSREKLPVAIGVIPETFFFGSGIPDQTTFRPVIYSDDQKRRMIRGLLLDWCELYRRDSKETYEHDWRRSYTDGPRDRLFELFAICKNAAFSDERELRFVYQESFVLSDFRIAPPKRFTVRGPLLRPYTTIRDLVAMRAGSEDRSGRRIEISEVVVGPHPHADVAAAGIREFLVANGYTKTQVALSLVPYR